MTLISRSEAAKRMGVTVQAVYGAIKEGRLTAMTDENGKVFVESDTLQKEWINKSKFQRVRKKPKAVKQEASYTSDSIPDYDESKARNEFLKGEFGASAQKSEDLVYANITLHIDWINNIVETRPDGDRTEELFIHEAAHLSIDPYVYGKVEWNEAVNLDGNFISTYAKDNPNNEDIAETFQAYIAVKFFPERISNNLRDTILSVCLNRFKYFDSLNLDLSIYK